MHRFVLKKCKGRRDKLVCPSCEDRGRTLVPYIDSASGDILANHVGICDRRNNCGYHYPPRQFFADNPDQAKPSFHWSPAPKKKDEAPGTSFIPDEFLVACQQPGRSIMEVAAKNKFVAFLVSTFGEEVAEQKKAEYHIGTSRHGKNATVFPLVDGNGKMRSGKIIEYEIKSGCTFTGQNCKRVKTSEQKPYWVHSALLKERKLPSFQFSLCLFGLQLLNRWPEKAVAIVESEKTAVIASIYMPRFIWMAAGSLNYLSANLCRCLAGRQVILYPDLKGLELWDRKRSEISAFCQCTISRLLEENASDEDKIAGLDLADYLLQFSPEEFAKASGMEVPAGPVAEFRAVCAESVVPEKEIFPSESGTGRDVIEESVSKTSQSGSEIQAFVDETGKLYLKTPTTKTYSVYPGVRQYNKRACLPQFVLVNDVNTSIARRVFIDPEKLIATIEEPQGKADFRSGESKSSLDESVG